MTTVPLQKSKSRGLLATLAAALLAACATSANNVDITKPVSGDAATNAEKAYRKGLEEKSSSAYLEATRYFEWVRNNFPYSQYAALSELALADMAYERDDYANAAIGYADFVKSHPSHPKADYASFRVGLSHFADRSSELFLLPPAHEKDQGPIRSALDAFQRFLRQFPKSDLVPEARRLADECRDRLAEHERYVADFYWSRGAWKGAAGRYLVLAETYGDLQNGKVKTEALWRAGQSLDLAGQLDEERDVLEKLVAESSSGERRRDAQERLAALRKQKAAAPPQSPKADGADAPKADAQVAAPQSTPPATPPAASPAPAAPASPAPDAAPSPAAPKP